MMSFKEENEMRSLEHVLVRVSTGRRQTNCNLERNWEWLKKLFAISTKSFCRLFAFHFWLRIFSKLKKNAKKTLKLISWWTTSSKKHARRSSDFTFYEWTHEALPFTCALNSKLFHVWLRGSKFILKWHQCLVIRQSPNRSDR